MIQDDPFEWQIDRSREKPVDQQPQGRDGKTLCRDKGHQWTVTGECIACGCWHVPQFRRNDER